jgi:hypothetical protein
LYEGLAQLLDTRRSTDTSVIAIIVFLFARYVMEMVGEGVDIAGE